MKTPQSSENSALDVVLFNAKNASENVSSFSKSNGGVIHDSISGS